jgi:hypothetical protein
MTPSYPVGISACREKKSITNGLPVAHIQHPGSAGLDGRKPSRHNVSVRRKFQSSRRALRRVAASPGRSRPYSVRTNVRYRKGWDERRHSNDRAIPPARCVPSHAGPPNDTAAPLQHPGGTPRPGACRTAVPAARSGFCAPLSLRRQRRPRRLLHAGVGHLPSRGDVDVDPRPGSGIKWARRIPLPDLGHAQH